MATLQEVANRAGLSKSTVARILRGENKGLRSDASIRAKRVRRVAARMGYRPNGYARAIAKGHFSAVALLLSTNAGRSNLPMSLLEGIHDTLARRDMELVLTRLPDDALADAGFTPRILREMRCDGLLINYTDHIPAKMVHLIEQSGRPAVWINTKQCANCVYPDEVQIGRLATEKLIAVGHRRIAFLDSTIEVDAIPEAHYSRRDRYEGYRQAMAAAGLTPRFVGRYQGRQVPGNIELLSEVDRPTAIVSQSHSLDGKLTEACVLRGLSIPRDLSVVGFSTQGEWQHVRGVAVAHVVVPFREVGQLATNLLLDQLNGARGVCGVVAVPGTEFFGGSSIAPP